MNNNIGWYRFGIVLSVLWTVILCSIAAYEYFIARQSDGLLFVTYIADSAAVAKPKSEQEEFEFRLRAEQERGMASANQTRDFDPDAYLAAKHKERETLAGTATNAETVIPPLPPGFKLDRPPVHGVGHSIADVPTIKLTSFLLAMLIPLSALWLLVPLIVWSVSWVREGFRS